MASSAVAFPVLPGKGWELSGLDLNEPPAGPPPEQLFDWTA